LGGGLRSERGDTLVEFALTSFLFLMTFLGTVEFGLIVWQYNIVSDLAQEGARWASVRGSRGSSPASTADVQTFVRARSPGWLPVVTTFSADPVTKACTTTATAPSALDAGDGLCVTVVQSFAPLTRVIPLATLNLQSTAQMTIAR
jgi:Flp pilus assembly protein TadG